VIKITATQIVSAFKIPTANKSITFYLRYGIGILGFNIPYNTLYVIAWNDFTGQMIQPPVS